MAIYNDSAIVRFDLRCMGGIPLNDAYANAIALNTSLPSILPKVTNLYSTDEPGENNLFGFVIPVQSIWYTFTPTGTGYYEFRATNIVKATSATFLSCRLYLRKSSTLADFTTVKNSDYRNHRGGGSAGAPINDVAVQGWLDVGETYTLKMYTEGNANFTNERPFHCDLQVDLLPVSPPANDNWDDATVISTTLPNTQANQTTYDATKEPGEPNNVQRDQTVWYEFTPTVTATYKFTIPKSSLTYVGDEPLVFQNTLEIEVLPAGATLATSNNANGDNKTTGLDATDIDAEVYVALEAGITRKIMVSCQHDLDLVFNSMAYEFDLVTEQVPAPVNDNFDDAEVISGTSGTTDFPLMGSTYEVDEPFSHYGYDPLTQVGTVWFDWTCPATGYYKFTAEATDVDFTTWEGPEIDVGIYTGTAVDALTTIMRNSGGEHPNVINPNRLKTGIGLNATNGVSYKIQVAVWEPQPYDFRLSWATMAAPVGDTTSGLSSTYITSARVDNFGYTDNELPPNAVTLLSPHPMWNLTDGQPGRSRWFMYEELVGNRRMTLKAWMWLTSNDWSAAAKPCMIAYKGANYASLAVATDAITSENAAMMLDIPSSIHPFETATGTREIDIDVTLGEKLWICIFGIYDADYADATAADVPQFSMDLDLVATPPGNDDLQSVDFLSMSVYHLDKSSYDFGYIQKHAGKIEGTTVGATAQAGEIAHAGFAATRSVWFTWRPPYVEATPSGSNQDIPWKLWIESDVDCVMSVYNYSGWVAGNFASLTLRGEDDDSGPGDQPEVTILNDANTAYFVCVDSKAEGQFTLYWQRQTTTVKPVNDDFVDAIDLGSEPAIVSGTTIGGTGEPDEYESDWNGIAATDGVWYKYTPNYTGLASIRGSCLTFHNDAWVLVHVFEGSSLEDLTLVSENSEDSYGQFYYGDDPDDQYSVLFFPVVADTEYYIRVATWSGGSEEFIIWVDTQLIQLNLTASGTEEGPSYFQVEVNLTASGSDEYDIEEATLDSATATVDLRVTFIEAGPYDDTQMAYVDMLPSGSEFVAVEALDAATVLLNLEGIALHECYFHTEPSFIAAGNRKWVYSEARRWAVDSQRRWVWIEGTELPQEC